MTYGQIWHTTIDSDLDMRSARSSNALYALLSNPQRADVLRALIEAPEERSVSEIARELELDSSTVSRSLRAFRDAGLATYRREKKRHLYRLTEAVEVSINDEQWRIGIACRDAVIRIDIPKSTR